MRVGTRIGASLLVGAAGAWASPLMLRVGPLRLRLSPKLAGVGGSRHVAITFDDGPDAGGTHEVVAALARLGWQATFFLVGEQVRLHPELARAVRDAGHEIALHGDEHRNHLFRSGRDVDADLRRGMATVVDATGMRPVYFRPPFGVLTAGSLAAARRQHLRPVLWTAWGRDWERSSGHEVAATVMSTLDARGTVLLHDSDRYARSPQCWKATVESLPLLARVARQQGWTVGPLRDHFRSEADVRTES